ncbi:MAG: TonB family protein [Mucilaginibacter sp.]|uniref:TonB family protein n=1 Tax=Mucilaginibacter sp. TaxID=1882438 RepID=UPI0034E5C523
MNWWHYLILANLYLALFYGFYLLLLRKETYFMLNRIYLVSAAVLSFFIPMMQAEWVKNLFITQKVQQTIYYIDPGFVYQVSPSAESGFTVSQFFTAVYWLVTMLLLARLIYRFVKLKRYLQSAETGLAFSFFGKVKVDENLPQQDVILQHEMVHVAQLHSADVLLFEALAILNWFNPVIYFYRKAIKHNHEFIADRDAISFGVDKSDYALLLLSQSMGIEPNTLTNSFFNQSLLKQRIMMLHKNPSRRAALLKYGLSAPLFAAMLVLTSATVSEQKTIQQISDNFGSDIPVNSVVMNIGESVSSPLKTTSAEKGTVKTVSDLKGKVVNPLGKPMANVKVQYEQNNFSTTTDEDGDFEIPNYTERAIVTFKSPDSTVLVTTFDHVAGKLKIVVFEDKAMAKARANMLVVKPSSEPGVVSFASVEKPPSFPGGEEGFANYLAKSIHYPKEAKDKNIQGRVIISFIVEKDGKLTNLKVLRDIGGGCGPEAVRVLEESPNWNPGLQNSKPVRVSFTMPVNFSLNDGTKASTSSTSKKDSIIDIVLTPPPNADTTKRINVVRVDGNALYNKAMVIIDGVEAKGINPLNNINPNDIESITVLKGASATAKYGDKGKDGVIEITTKKGKKNLETEKKKP